MRNGVRHTKERHPGSRVKAAVFFCVLFFGMVFSLILPLRPTESLQEKRRLTEFPAFSVESLLDGSYFRGIDDWFSDTFPMRDSFLELNRSIRSFFGIHTVEITGEVQQGDEIPDTPFTGK